MPQQQKNRRISKIWTGYFGTLVRRFATQYWLTSTAFLAVPCVAQPSGIVYSTAVAYTGTPAATGFNLFPNPTVQLLVTDASGNTYVAGAVTSGGLPVTPGVVQTNYEGGICDLGGGYESPCPNVFLAKLNLTFANVTYAGNAPGLVSGVTQVNFPIPQMANFGAGPPYQALMVLTAGTASSGMITDYEGNVESELSLILWYQ
jgi:hypothetical protein